MSCMENGGPKPIGKVHDALFNRQTRPAPGKPHGWIQWKGTDVCMDLHCLCGELTHVDAMFTYAVRCGKCKRTYYVNGHVEMVPMTEAEAAAWDKEDNCEAVETEA